MYLINKAENRIQQIDRKSFHDLGFRERAHLQEWLANHPSALGEPLLIIQKEFAGFSETMERLDLLALDKDGNTVIIENKLDDTGRDVTWQALKYASYCSALSSEEIVNIFQDYLNAHSPGTQAREQLDFFFENGFDDTDINKEQRIILVAANFRKEVTSTVIWLSRFNIRAKCLKATAYQHGDMLLLNLEQIIPIKEAEDYIIRMAGVAKEEISRKEDSGKRYQTRREFWAVLLQKIKGRSPIFQGNNPTKDNLIYAGGTDMTNVAYFFQITKSFGSVGLKMSRENREDNKFIYDHIAEYKEEIEARFG